MVIVSKRDSADWKVVKWRYFALFTGQAGVNIPPMMNFCVLGSGSGGNAALVRTGNTTVLIDAGFSALRLKQRLHSVGVDPDSIDAILLTHEHSDHSSALFQFTRKHAVRVYGTRHTCMYLRDQIPNAAWTYIEKEHSFAIGNLVITPFGISHDAVDPVGFRIESPTSTLGYLSDTGCINGNILSHLQEVHSLYLESNYDPELLQTTPRRPWPVKQRIASRHGHLSNAQAGELVAEIIRPTLENIILGHLSSESNTEELALASMLKTLEDAQMPTTSLLCSRQHEILPWINVKRMFL